MREVALERQKHHRRAINQVKEKHKLKMISGGDQIILSSQG